MRNYRTVCHKRQTAAGHASFAGRRVGIVLADEAAGRAAEYLQSVNRQRLWRLARAYWFDALLAVAVVVGVVEVVLRQDVEDGPLGPLWFDVLAVLGMTLPLFARRRFPLGALVTSGVVFAASSFVDGRVASGVIPFLTALAVLVLFGLIRDRTQAMAGLGFGIGVTAIVFHNDPKGGSAGGFAFTCVVFTIAWAIGFVLGHKFREADEARERLAHAERQRAEQARFAVAEERTRIARELHDVVGHSVSVMTVQAAAARRLLRPHQEREREALLVVEQTGREALAEMRRMVGVLRSPGEEP
jgi:signal transduction histidine kinase